ncbi:hypothetical protein BTVI_27673 [Pitangus sulphuratus]|nr:hypothetical protein BTVI_27673 [Pitangus sulphuratus]
MAATMILSWMVMISLQIQVDAGLSLRLSGGPDRCAGNVEILYYGDWEKVCGHLWNMEDAEVVCRQLGCGSPLGVMHSFPSSDLYPYVITEVNCAGYEEYLWECPYNYQYYVCHHGDASVICSDSGLTVPPPTVTTISNTMFPVPWTAGMSRGFMESD